MVSPLSDVEKVRALLDREHELNAMVIDRIFSPSRQAEVYVDNEGDPHGVMTRTEQHPRHVCIYADNEDSFFELIDSLESGKECRFSGLRDIYLPLLEERFEIKDYSPCWFFVLGEEGPKGEVLHVIDKLTEEDIPIVSGNWEQFPGAHEHVKDRILNGDSVAARIDGELVGWDATHFETDKVVMLGFLFIMEQYRKSGIATSLCVTLTKRVLERGKTPIFYVMKDNEPSIKFSLKLGYEIIDSHSWTTGVKK